MTRRSNIPPKIFLSYNHKDRAFGEYLVQHLRHAIGHTGSIWYDNGLRVGDNWSEKIMEELARSNTFIVLLSPNALKSRWVKTEIHTAWDRHNKNKMFIMPIVYRECKIPTKLAFLNTVQFVSFSAGEDFDAAFKKLLDALNISPNNNVDNPMNSKNSLPVSAQVSNNTRTHRYIISSNIHEIAHCIEEAYNNQDWYSVTTISDALNKIYANLLPTSILKMRTFAYLYKNSEKMNKDRYALAQKHLKKVLNLIQEPQLRLDLLDAYVLTLIEQDIQGEELTACIEEALRLAPDDVSWKELQNKLPLLALNDEKELPPIKKRKISISKGAVYSLIPVIFLALPLFRHFAQRK